MKLIKMTIINSEEFERALVACRMAFGCITIKKRTLIWFVTFEEGDAAVIRDCLEEVGSKYRGTWHF